MGLREESTYRALAALIAFIIAVSSASSVARAEDFFVLTATPSGGAPVTGSGGNLRNLLDSMIHAQGPYAPLAGNDYTASLKYGSRQSALVFNGSADGKTLTLSIPSQNFSKTFTADTRQQVQEDVRAFLQSGVDAYSRLLSAISKETAVGLLDGNPRAATAVLADDAFFRWGIEPTLSQSTKLPGKNGAQVRFDFNAGGIRTANFDGTYVTAALGLDWRINDRIGLSVGLPFEYREIGNTTSYIAGANLGLPIAVIPRNGDGFAWQITPFMQGWGAISGDLVAGGVLIGGGGVSSLSYQTGAFTFTLADQIGYSGGVGIDINEFHFDTDVDQWILKNGVKVTYAPVGSPFFVDGGAAYTNFLHNTAVDGYVTPFVGVGVKFTPYSGIRVGYRGNYGNGYSDTGGDVIAYLSF
jgi:hypothetical protein